MEPHIYKVSINRPSHGLYIGNILKEVWPCPDSFAQLTWLSDLGFQLTMWSYETSPLAKYTDSNDPINQDSCLACFINAFPRYPYKGYISIEFNANGACRCSFGPNSTERKDIADYGIPTPTIEISHPTRDGGNCWMGKTIIPKEFIEATYGLPCRFRPGDKMRANFYAFSEHPRTPYWGAWAPISQPDLHRLEHFGLIEII